MLSSEFNNYISTFEDRYKQLEQDKEKNKHLFFEKCLVGENTDITYDDMLQKIKENLRYIISKDPTLQSKIKSYLDLLNTNNSNNDNNINNINNISNVNSQYNQQSQIINNNSNSAPAINQSGYLNNNIYNPGIQSQVNPGYLNNNIYNPAPQNAQPSGGFGVGGYMNNTYRY